MDDQAQAQNPEVETPAAAEGQTEGEAEAQSEGTTEQPAENAE